MTENSVTEIPIASIRMTGRYRNDYGDIATLASSIEQLGLLQPIGVTASNKLVFGQRRVLAFQRLGRSTIPARVIDVPALVLAEHAENEIRKDFTPLERVAIGEAVEAELGKRQGQRTDLASEGQGGLLELPPNLEEVAGKETQSAEKGSVDDSWGERMTAAQRKGARGEREFCVLLSEHLGEKYFRQLGAARDGGPDVLIGERWAVEVKRAEKPEFGAWWEQAFRQAMACGRFPALAYRASRQSWTVAVPLDVLLFGRVLWEDQGSHAPWCPWESTAKLTLEGFATVVREIV